MSSARSFGGVLLSPQPAHDSSTAQPARQSAHSLSGNDRTNVAVLIKAGVLVENEDRFFIPSADVLAGLAPVG